MHSKHDNVRDTVRVYSIDIDEHPDGVLGRLIRNVFKDQCGKCGLPSFIEINSLPQIEFPRLKSAVGLACGFWLARKATAELLCSEFENQFEMRKLSDDAYFLMLKNTLIPVDPFYDDGGDCDPVFFKNKERICSLCGRPYILLNKGFINFDGGNHIKPKTIYETSLKFGQAFLKYPFYFCDEEAVNALRRISRKFRFIESAVKFTVDAV